MPEPTEQKKKDEDEVTLAKSIFDEIVEETERDEDDHEPISESSGKLSNKGNGVCLGNTLLRNS